MMGRVTSARELTHPVVARHAVQVVVTTLPEHYIVPLMIGLIYFEMGSGDDVVVFAHLPVVGFPVEAYEDLGSSTCVHDCGVVRATDDRVGAGALDYRGWSRD
jgi:hypothetical protein